MNPQIKYAQNVSSPQQICVSSIQISHVIWQERP